MAEGEQIEGQDLSVSAAEIARKSQSNLAFALACLPPQRKHDMQTFYAFCRIVDDLADNPDLPETVRRRGLDRWRAVVMEEARDLSSLEESVASLSARYTIDRSHLTGIIDGCEADLTKKRYETITELRDYCYQVACLVGLVSIEIFGYKDPACRDYAVELGYALQMTNILRDVGTDLRDDDRIYLPQEDLSTYAVTEKSLRAGRCDTAFLKLMTFQADRAEAHFCAAREHLPVAEFRSMASAETMGEIYHGILKKMRADGFRVFEKRYRLTKPAKALILLKGVWRSRRKCS